MVASDMIQINHFIAVMDSQIYAFPGFFHEPSR